MTMQTKNDLLQLSVSDLMSRDIVSIGARETLHEAVELMVSSRISAIPVVDSRQRCIGIISTTDVLAWAEEFDSEVADLSGLTPLSREWLINRLQSGQERTVGEVMTPDVVTVESTANLQEVARIMSQNGIHHVPVVDPQGTLVGVVSTFDLVRAMADATKN